ncbi:MAG: Ger(x)C family spore germination protein [Bacillota bacterium]|nr:Ger(x)C family spore germination protein [Bacillota bacterium]
MYKRQLIIIIFFMLSTLSGCWDNKDIDHRVMPIVLGISKESEKYKVFLQIPTPENGTIQTKVVSGTGRTLNEIIDSISSDMESDLDLLHVKVIVVDRELAEEGLKDLISGFLRSREVASKASLVICDEDIDNFFSKLDQQEGSMAIALLDYFEKNAGWDPHIALTRVWEVYRSIHSYTLDVAVPIMTLGETTLFKQLGSAVIKNGKMVGEINSDETLLYNAFNGEKTQGQIEVLDDASVLILSQKLHHNSDFTNRKPLLSTTLTFNVMILETRGNPSTELIKNELIQLLEGRFERMFASAQKSQSDILGIGQYFRNDLSREELKNWRKEFYPDLTVDLTIQVDIQNSGNLKSPTK